MIVELERVVVTAPFGLRLRSEATGAAVSRGLAVSLSDPAARFAPVEPTANSSHIFAAHRLPGFSQVDLAAPDWAAIARPMRLEVSDASGQYLPFTATMVLPVRGFAGLDALALASPLGPPAMGADSAALPLFPSPAFAAPGPLALVRVELIHDDGAPAAWSLVIVEIGGVSYRGVTDERGVGLVAFGWPRRPPPVLPGSPPATAGYTWDASVTVFSDRLPADRPPDLAALLAQADGPPLALEALPGEPPLAPPVLAFARPLTLPPAVLVPA